MFHSDLMQRMLLHLRLCCAILKGVLLDAGLTAVPHSGILLAFWLFGRIEVGGCLAIYSSSLPVDNTCQDLSLC